MWWLYVRAMTGFGSFRFVLQVSAGGRSLNAKYLPIRQVSAVQNSLSAARLVRGAARRYAIAESKMISRVKSKAIYFQNVCRLAHSQHSTCGRIDFSGTFAQTLTSSTHRTSRTRTSRSDNCAVSESTLPFFSMRDDIFSSTFITLFSEWPLTWILTFVRRYYFV
jgi:hypothetical protein